MIGYVNNADERPLTDGPQFRRPRVGIESATDPLANFTTGLLATEASVAAAGLAIVLVVDDGKPLVNVTFCLHAACERPFVATHPPTRGARWMTFPLAQFLATLLKNATSLEGAAAPQPIGH